MNITRDHRQKPIHNFIKRIALPAAAAATVTACTVRPVVQCQCENKEITINNTTEKSNQPSTIAMPAISKDSALIYAANSGKVVTKPVDKQPEEAASVDFKTAIFQALPYINNGKFKKVEVKSNGIEIDGKYKLKKKGNDYFEGDYGLFDEHSFKIKKLKNGNFDLIYKNGDNIEAVAFSKDAKMLGLMEAVNRNFPKPNAGKTEPKGLFNFGMEKNTEDNIIRYNNPLSPKEFKFIKNYYSKSIQRLQELKKQGKLPGYKYFQEQSFEQKDGKILSTIKVPHSVALSDKQRIIKLKFENTRGLEFEASGDEGTPVANRISITPLENDGYYMEISNTDRENQYVKAYFDKDLNLKSKSWYEKDKATIEEQKHKQEQFNLENAIATIKAGHPVKYPVKNGSLVLVPKPDEYVTDDTSLAVRFETSWDELPETLDKLPPEVKAAGLIGTIAVGGILLDAMYVSQPVVIYSGVVPAAL